MTLVYCNYPILDHEDQPDWVGMLHYVRKKGMLKGVQLYQPFYPLADQVAESEGLAEALSADMRDRDSKLNSLVDMLHLEHIFMSYRLQSDRPYRPDYKDVLAVEKIRTPMSHHTILKDMWVLSRCDIVVTDCNTPDHGTKDSINLMARILGLTTVGVSDRFVTGPWLHATCDFAVKTLQLADLLDMLAKTLESQKQPETASEETNKGQTDGVQLQDS